MSDRAHVIETDSIVLTGVDLQDTGRQNALIEAEIRRTLEGTRLHAPRGIRNNEMRVAGEVAGTVVQSLQGGTDGV